MDMKLELVAVPVSDPDRAKAFYTEKVGFNADHDFPVQEGLRFIQLTPPDRRARSRSGSDRRRPSPGQCRRAPARGRQRRPGAGGAGRPRR